MEKIENELLVSVIVVTYNAHSFIIETLESVKAQTYKNIELIVSDDGSLDSTLLIAKNWLSVNSDRFVRTEIVSVIKNTGVSANCNRGILAAKSDWIKFIAGDDILLPNCIQDNVAFVMRNEKASVVFSQVELYKNNFLRDSFVTIIPQGYPSNIMDPLFTALDQFKRLLVSDRINFTPSYFFNKQVVLSVGGYDEQNKQIEDYPMWLKLTQAGNKLFFFEKPTVGYRQHDKAINNNIRSELVKQSVFASYPFRKVFVHSYLPWDIVWSERLIMFISFIFKKLKINKDTLFLRSSFKLLAIYLNPFKYFSFLKKKLMKVDPIYYSQI